MREWWHGRRIAIALAVVVAGALVAAVVYDAGRKDRIADGVRVGGIDVGGLGADRARAVVHERLAPRFARPVVVTHHRERFTFDPRAAGVHFDAAATVRAALRRSREGTVFGRSLRDLAGGRVEADLPPVLRFSRARVEAFARRLAQRIDRPARDADIDLVGYRIRRQPARKGLTVRRAALVDAITAHLRSSRAEGPIPVPVKVTERPDRTMAELRRRYRWVITVSRRRKILRVYRRLRLLDTYRIAVGKAGHSTPAGRYEITTMQKNPAWHAPQEEWAGELAGQIIPPGDPRNPLEARWLGFHDGAGIHGTSDLASLGGAASHGCIRMSVRDVKELYRRVETGTPVFIA